MPSLNEYGAIGVWSQVNVEEFGKVGFVVEKQHRWDQRQEKARKMETSSGSR